MLNGRMIVNSEEAVDHFNILFQHFPEEKEDNNE
jgi:hypothetical protein